MLLRPPFIQQDDVKSQTSNPMSHMQKQKSVKSTSKNKKKQNTIGTKKSNMMMGMPYSNLSKEIESHNNNGYDSDNGSVHSVNSRKSKGRAKQSTIAIGKKQPQLINTNQNSAYSIKNTKQKQQYEIFKLDDEDDDNRSVGSHASRNSRKNTKKQNSLGGVRNKANQKVNVQLNYYYNDKNNNNNNDSNNNTQRDYYMEQQSKVQIVKLTENTDTFTQPLKYNQALQKNAPVLGKNPQSKRRTQHVVTNNKQPVMSASPFQEITLKRQEEYDDQPVYRLKQPEENNNRKYGGNNNVGNNNLLNMQQNQQYQQNPFSQRATNNNNNPFAQQNTVNKPLTLLGYQNYENQKPTQQQKQPTLQQSTPAIQPQMISTKSVTKSRRNKIFDNDNNSISNSSNIMNSRSNNNMEGSFQRSRSKSKSKLGELLKQSREKQKRQGEMSKAIEKQPYSTNVIKPVELGYRQQQNRQQQQQQQRVRYENNNKTYGYNNNINYNNTSEIINKNYQLSQKQQQQQQQSNTSPFSYNINPSININQTTSRLGNQKLQQNYLKPQPIKRKSIQNQQFDLGESNLQLNLSMSHKVPQQPQSITSATTGLMKGDSVLFNFQPQRKKGISITSKDNKPSSTSSISRAQNKSIQSKKHLDRLMRKCQQNQQFLAKSILSNSSELRESSKRIGVVNNNNVSSNVNVVNSPNLNMIKREETLTRPFEKIKQNPIRRQRVQQPQQQQLQPQQPAWHQMVKNDAAFQIKSVQRKEIRRPSQQVIKVNHQPQPQFQFQQTKPMSPAEFFRLQNQQQQQLYQQQQPQQRSQKNIIPQQQDVRIHQIEQKNRILAQINKKSKPQQLGQKQISHQKDNFSWLQNKNKMKSPEPFYQNQQYQGDQQEINLNYSDAQDVRDKQKSTKNNNQNSNKQSLKDHVQASSLSHQLSLSENGSQRSNSQSAKKQRKKQSSLNIMKKHKVQVREQQPRAQQSFYQQPPQQQQQIPLQQNIKYKQQVKMTKVQSEDNTDRTFKLQQSKTKIDYKKPNLINFQENEIEQEKIKSKTDMNFYNYGDGSQRSIRVPSSKPPLSRKSNCSSSKSKSKAKQSTLNINPVKKETKIKQVTSNQNNNLSQQQQQPKKKKTLLQIAQDKQYEGSGYGGSDSQCSFNSRQSFGSVNSKNSRRSQSSKKQSTLPITIKNSNKSTTMNQFRPSLNKLPSSTNSQVEIFSNNIIDNQSIYNSLKQQSVRRESRERERTQQSFNQQQQYPRHEQRTIVSKDTYYIDQRGRLVKQDLIIKGNQIYTQPSSNWSAQQMAMERMRRSREHHRSRSKSRDGSRSRLSKKTSQSSMEESGCESMASSQSNYYNNNKGSTNYGSSQYGMINQQRQGNLYIEQFIKPIQQQPSNRGRQLSNQQPNQQYRFQKPSSNNNQRRTQIQHQFYQSSQYNQPQQQYYESQYSYQQNDQYEEYEQEEPQVQRVTLNQLFGRNKKNNNTKQSNNNNSNSSSSYYNQQQRSSQNNSNYQQNYNNTGSSRRQQYGGTTNSRYNPQQSALGQSSRKKSLSRTQKTFYHK